MTEGRKKFLRFAFPILGVFWLWFGWFVAAPSGPRAMWSGLLAGVVHLAAAVQLEWKIRRDKRLSELREELGDDGSAAHCGPVTTPRRHGSGRLSLDQRRVARPVAGEGCSC